MKKYFNNINESDLYSIREMCKAIESKKVFIVCTDSKFKMLVSGANYTYDYTYNLCRFGFAQNSLASDNLAKLNKYTPHQSISYILCDFLNTAVEMGLYERTTDEVFHSGLDFQMIWMY